jgi:hypothetical protein
MVNVETKMGKFTKWIMVILTTIPIIIMAVQITMEIGIGEIIEIDETLIKEIILMITINKEMEAQI